MKINIQVNSTSACYTVNEKRYLFNIFRMGRAQNLRMIFYRIEQSDDEDQNEKNTLPHGLNSYNIKKLYAYFPYDNDELSLNFCRLNYENDIHDAFYRNRSLYLFLYRENKLIDIYDVKKIENRFQHVPLAPEHKKSNVIDCLSHFYNSYRQH